MMDQEVRVEDVDAHAGESHIRIVGQARRIGRLFQEAGDGVVGIHVDDPEGRRGPARHLHAADRGIRVPFQVLRQHLGIVLLVDVVAGQDQDVVRFLGADGVQVLIDGIGGTAVPDVFPDLLLCRPDLDELAHFRAQKAPAALHMLDQGVGLVLGGHADPANARIDAVRKREVDDAELAGKRNRRLGLTVGEVKQT